MALVFNFNISLALAVGKEATNLTPHFVLNAHQFFKLQIDSHLELKFTQVQKPRFVKNQKLQWVVESQKDDWGLLSMDNEGRILIQSKKCHFPIIGVWEHKGQDDIPTASTYLEILEFLKRNYPNKCKFQHEGQDYIYYVSIKKKKRALLELYLVAWHELQSSQEKLKSTLQFTLRSQENTLEDLLGFNSPSPIKFLNEDVENILCKTDNDSHDSPRFQEIDKLEDQNKVLKETVRRQAMEISLLKTELIRMRNQMKFASKTKHTLNQSKLFSSGKSPESIFSPIDWKCAKKLTESDLQTSSANKDKNRSTEGSSNCLDSMEKEKFRKAREMIMNSKQQRYPWEDLEIVEP